MDRDLDATIAKEIFKWRYIHISADYNGENACDILYPPGKEADQDFYSLLPRVGKIHEGYATPNWSGDIEKAIELCKIVKLPLLVSDFPTDPKILSQMCLDHWRQQNEGDKK